MGVTNLFGEIEDKNYTRGQCVQEVKIPIKDGVTYFTNTVIYDKSILVWVGSTMLSSYAKVK